MYEDLIARLRKMSKISAGLSVLLPKAGGDAMAELLEEAADALEKERSQPMPQSPGDGADMREDKP